MQLVAALNIHKGDTEDYNVCFNGDFGERRID
jgi:hypothetical protein